MATERTNRTKLSEKLEDMIQRAKNVRDGEWEREVEKIEDFERNQPPEAGNATNIKMTLSSQYCREIGSRLYNRNPTVRVTPEQWADDIAKARAPVEENLLNLAMERTNFFGEFRDCVTESFTAYGVLWHGVDRDDPRLPSVKWGRWSDLWFDCDVSRIRDSNYIVKRCRKSRAYLIDKYARDEEGNLKKSISQKIMQAQLSNSSDGENADRDNRQFSNASVVYYKVYTKVGLDAFDEDLNETPSKDTAGQAKLYVILDGCWDVIFNGAWETPYHITGEYPCTILKYYENRNMVYPSPPLMPGVPWMEALDKAVNDLVSQYKFTSRMVLAKLKGAGLDIETPDMKKILAGSEGSPIALVDLEVNSALAGNALKGIDIRRYLHVMDLGDDRYIQKLEHVRQLKDEWYRAVGMNDWMYFGDSGKQDRSAKATASREKNAMSRVADMQSCIDEFASTVLAKMLFTARIHDTETDVGQLMGPEAGKVWGTTLAGEQAESSYWEDYYQNNPDEVTSGSDAREMAMETLNGGVDLLSWLDSTKVAIELGSTARRTPQEEEEAIAQANNQLVPSLNNMGMPYAASLFVGKRAELLSMPADQVASIIQSGLSSQQLIDSQKQLQIAQLQAQLQQLQQQAQVQGQQQAMAQEQQAQQQALAEHQAVEQSAQKEQELAIKNKEAEAKLMQAARPVDRSKP